MRLLVVILSVVLVWFLFAENLYSNLAFRPNVNYTDTQSFSPFLPTKPTRKVITDLNKEIDMEWIPILQYGNIVAIRPIREEVRGLAEKWLVTFDTGHEAMAKPVETWSFLEQDWPTIDYNENLEQSGWRIRRADRKMQGYNEIAAYYFDRILGLWRKPPIVGRYISSKLLYPLEFSLNGVKHLSFEQAVPVSLHAWMDGIETDPPEEIIQDFLTFRGTSRFGNWERSRAAYVSDTLVFDFLLDDHDRNLVHNWKSDSANRLLLWDSGLALNHGPQGRSSCLRLLCGPELWEERDKALHEPSCQKICRFRKATIQQLENSYRAAEEEKLGQLFQNAIEQDLLHPVLQYNLYYLYGRQPKVRFQLEDFYRGFDVKVNILLSHANECVTKYGESLVYF